MKEFKITEERLKAMAKKYPEVESILKEGFPEAFEEEWEDVTLNIKLKQRETEGEGEIGAMIRPEDFFMPYDVQFVDIWGGTRNSNNNPMTDIATYKLVNGRIYRKEKEDTKEKESRKTASK